MWRRLRWILYKRSQSQPHAKIWGKLKAQQATRTKQTSTGLWSYFVVAAAVVVCFLCVFFGSPFISENYCGGYIWHLRHHNHRLTRRPANSKQSTTDNLTKQISTGALKFVSCCCRCCSLVSFVFLPFRKWGRLRWIWHHNHNQKHIFIVQREIPIATTWDNDWDYQSPVIVVQSQFRTPGKPVWSNQGLDSFSSSKNAMLVHGAVG